MAYKTNADVSSARYSRRRSIAKQRPAGRSRVNGGAGKTVRTSGSGIGSGPVGSRSSVQRAFNAGARAGTVGGALGRRKK